MVSADLIFKIAGIAMIVSVIHSVIKQAGKDEYLWMVTLTGVVLVLSLVINVVADFFRAVRTTFQLP
ncbi:MAG TPA: stage III sporulation protein AC [Firmicutes bacterium]|nr:stage III sporulation protein AC [Candidatus Fermentithermobacillaceae bacterium]